MKTNLPKSLKYILAIIGILVVGFGLYKFVPRMMRTAQSSSWADGFSTKMNLKRLTVSGTAIQSAISPDGGLFAFSQREADLQSLWIRAINSNDARRLVAAGIENFTGICFSPDGKFVYYTTFNPENSAWTLYRIGTGENGVAQEISKDVVSNVSCSSDGKRIAYFYLEAKSTTMKLIVSEINEDGSLANPQTIAARVTPAYFTGNPAFSSDGRNIVFPATSLSKQKEVTNLFTVNLDSKDEEQLGETIFNQITAVAWRENISEIVISGNEKNTDHLNLHLVEYPTGKVTPLVNDLNDYLGVSLTKDSNALATVQKKTEASVSVFNLGDKVDSASIAETLTGGANRQDGMKGVAWTADGKILYVAAADKGNTVVLMNADGSNKQTFNLGAAVPSSPLMTNDGRFLFFIDQAGL